jgi:hypothetical protein
MANQSIIVNVKLAWWAKPYLHTLAFLCWLLSLEPNPERVEKVLSRACRIETRND